MPEEIVTIDNLLRLLCPTINRRYAKKRSILDFPPPHRININSDSISIFMFNSGKVDKCEDNPCSFLAWPDTCVNIVFCDVSCSIPSLTPWRITTEITQWINGSPTFIGSGICFYIHELETIINQFHPIWQECCGNKAPDKCYDPVDETEFNFITYNSFRSSFIDYYEEKDLLGLLDDSSGFPDELDFFRAKLTTNSGHPEGECYYPTYVEIEDGEIPCLDDPPLSYLFLDNIPVRSGLLTSDDLDQESGLPDLDRITPSYLADLFNFKDDNGNDWPISNITLVTGHYNSTVGVWLESRPFERDYYDCNDISNPDCNIFDPKLRPNGCCCDNLMYALLRYPCPSDNFSCDDKIPGIWLNLNFLELEVLSIRVFDPINLRPNELLPLIITAIDPFIPGPFSIEYSSESNSFILTSDVLPEGVNLELLFCPCPINTTWSKESATCCPTNE
jgi:hypothetical protein